MDFVLFEEIVPREAEIVRKAFYMAGMCHKYKEIVTELNRMEKESGSKVTEEKLGEIERVMVSDDGVEIVKKPEKITA